MSTKKLPSFENRNDLFELSPKDPLLEYHQNTVSDIRKLYNLSNEKDINEAINILDKWVKEQPHFKKKHFSRKYLEITLVSLKGSIERAKRQMNKLCTLKTVLPHFFNISDPIAEFSCFKGTFQYALLPKLTKEHYRLNLGRFTCIGNDSEFYFKIFKCVIATCEYLKLHDYCDGYVTVIDYRGIDIAQFLSEINISDMRKLATIVMQGYQLRLKGIHLVNESKTIYLLVKLFKQMFSQKIGQRIHVHESLDSLHNYVPREILPVEFGGDEKSMEQLWDNTLQVFGSEENIKDLTEMKGATINQSMRPNVLEDYEMIGTFRNLNVD